MKCLLGRMRCYIKIQDVISTSTEIYRLRSNLFTCRTPTFSTFEFLVHVIQILLTRGQPFVRNDFSPTVTLKTEQSKGHVIVSEITDSTDRDRFLNCDGHLNPRNTQRMKYPIPNNRNGGKTKSIKDWKFISERKPERSSWERPTAKRRMIHPTLMTTQNLINPVLELIFSIKNFLSTSLKTEQETLIYKCNKVSVEKVPPLKTER